ncbi:hypothetical protein [Shewanella baltica]
MRNSLTTRIPVTRRLWFQKKYPYRLDGGIHAANGHFNASA